MGKILFVALSLAISNAATVSASSTGICQPDGTLLTDPSITMSDATPTVGAAPAIAGPSGTGQMALIEELCSGTSTNGVTPNWQTSSVYTSSQDCFDKQYAALATSRTAAAAKAEQAAMQQASSAAPPSAGGSPSAGSPSQQQQQNQKNSENSNDNSSPASVGSPTAADNGSRGNASSKAQDDGAKGGGGCLASVKAQFAICDRQAKSAATACDSDQDSSIKNCNDTSNATQASISKSNYQNGILTQNMHATCSGDIADYANRCDTARVHCDTSCAEVAKKFAALCAGDKEKSAAQQFVSRSNDKQHQLMCEKDGELSTKIGQARQQSDTSGIAAATNGATADGANAGSGSGSGGSGSGSGSSGGAGAGIGAMSSLAGPLAGMGAAAAAKEKAEAAAQAAALQAITAAESTSAACQQPQYSSLKSCQCYGLTDAQCTAKLPNGAPTAVMAAAALSPTATAAGTCVPTTSATPTSSDITSDGGGVVNDLSVAIRRPAGVTAP